MNPEEEDPNETYYPWRWQLVDVSTSSGRQHAPFVGRHGQRVLVTLLAPRPRNGMATPGKDWEDDKSWTSSRSASRSSTKFRPDGPHVMANQQQTYQKGQREEQRSGKERSCERESPRTEHPSRDDITFPVGGGLCALGTHGYLAVWTHFCTTCQSFYQSITSPAQATNEKQEFLDHLRKAYPDPTTMPEETKQFIAKTEQETGRMGIKNLHQATKHLGKVKKHLGEVTDQRRAHRSLWMAHLSSGIKLWEKQLEDFRKHQSMLTEIGGQSQNRKLRPPAE